jgi:hypothetical protein
MSFNPKFLSELVNDLHSDKTKEIRKHIMESILSDDQNKGRFWEQVLAKHMPHTTLLEGNEWYRDFDDNSDGKFVTLSNIENKRNGRSNFQATIHIHNKIGTLRVCMCATLPGILDPKVYFMLIPFEAYEPYLNKTNEEGIPHPIKISFSNFNPYGELWNKYQTNFAGVTQPLSFDIKSELVYTDLDLYNYA